MLSRIGCGEIAEGIGEGKMVTFSSTIDAGLQARWKGKRKDLDFQLFGLLEC